MPSDSARETKSFAATHWIDLLTILLPIWYLLLGLGLEHFQSDLPYFVTEWMVTYWAGFVRRGLLGQTFLSLGDLFHSPPLLLIQIVRFFIATGFAATLAFQCRKNQGTLGLLGVAVVLSNPLITDDIWHTMGSFDLFFVLVTAFHLWVSRRYPERYWVWAVALFSIVGTILTLCHEAFLFLCLPANAAISWYALKEQWAAKMIAIYAGPVAAFLVASKFHGTKAQELAIAKLWADRGVMLSSSNAIQPIGHGLANELAYMKSLVNPSSVMWCVVAGLFCAAPLVVLARALWNRANSAERTDIKRQLIAFLVVPVAATLPLYVIGSDWHRWLALPFATAVLCFLIARPTSQPLSPSKKLTATLAALAFIGLLIIPMAPYMPRGQILTGPIPSTARLASWLIRGKG